MVARLRVFLTPEEDRTIRELHRAKVCVQGRDERSVNPPLSGISLEVPVHPRRHCTREPVRPGVDRCGGGCVASLRASAAPAAVPAARKASHHRGDGQSRPAPERSRHHGPVA